MAELEKVLELQGIHKSFPGVKALTDVGFNVRRGEVHALVGENGAGKSTLIKIITGFHKMDEGSILVDGEEATFSDPQQAIAKGIACIYQELSIVPLLDVAKNLFLGNWPQRGGLLDKAALYNRAAEILGEIELDVSPRTMAGDLSVAQQQMVEIGRALTRSARIIIMDEPTSSLTDKESEVLFGLIEKLRASGVSIVYISHKLNEVLRISDRITVLCDGRKITTVETSQTTRSQLIEYMLGRSLENMFNKTVAQIGEPVLQVEGLTRSGAFEDISFQVRSGEVVGFFGLVGAGRSEIMRALFGVDKADGGRVLLDGQPVDIKSAGDATRLGIALVPEDRKREGLALGLSVMENMTVAKLPQLRRGIFIDQKERERLTGQYIQDVNVKTPTPRQIVTNLSGGNQQKVVISKWLMANPRVLILDEPTRGIDVGSKAEIYGLICNLAKQGVAVIVVSSDMTEILGLSDRIITVFEGHITADIPAEGATDTAVLAAALGGGVHA